MKTEHRYPLHTDPNKVLVAKEVENIAFFVTQDCGQRQKPKIYRMLLCITKEK